MDLWLALSLASLLVGSLQKAGALDTIEGAVEGPYGGDLPSERIVGGVEVEPGSLPYMVALYLNTSAEIKFHCGGTIISEHHVLTAGHCVQGWSAWRLTVVTGTHDLTSPSPNQVTVPVAEVTIHEYFFFEDFSAIPFNDVALLRLAWPLDLISGQLAALPMPSQDQDPLPGTPCTIAGWGATEEGGPLSSVLISTSVPVVEQVTCLNTLGARIRPSMMCAGLPEGGYDACAGDSGGPLVCEGLLQGISSWGVGCARPQEYGVYTRVASFSDWIEKHNYVPK